MDERIVIDPENQRGKPVIRGTRVPVSRIIGGLAGDMTREEIMREYEVTEEDIRAALGYAAELIATEEFHPLPVPLRWEGPCNSWLMKTSLANPAEIWWG